MGIFHKYVPVFNRAPVDITVRFDGQDLTLAPGVGALPEMVIQFGKNQNPIMGTQDPNNPHISGGQYLLGVIGEDNCDPLSVQEWATHLGKPCRTDEDSAFQDKYSGDPKARQVIHGKGRKSTASSRIEAGTAPRGEASFESRD